MLDRKGTFFTLVWKPWRERREFWKLEEAIALALDSMEAWRMMIMEFPTYMRNYPPSPREVISHFYYEFVRMYFIYFGLWI